MNAFEKLKILSQFVVSFLFMMKKIYLDEGCENVLSNVVRIELFMQFFNFVLYLHFFTHDSQKQREKNKNKKVCHCV